MAQEERDRERRDADNEADNFEDAEDGTPETSDTEQKSKSPEEEPEPALQTAELSTVELQPTEPDVAAADLRSLSPDAGSSAAVEQQPPTKRKLFGWLSRSTSNNVTEKRSNSISGPTGTISSVLSNGGTPEATPSRGTNGYEIGARLHRNSLKDRFKLVRMREEAGIEAADDRLDLRPRSSDGAEADKDDTLKGHEELPEEEEVRAKKRTSSSASRPGQPTINVHLPPGTAAGTTAGPLPEAAEDVDWDLWQEVVYEGPSAVARTSGNELTEAIMRGIPSAIRGVIWQVLAQSKNEELESVYRDLVARGRTSKRPTIDLKPRPASSSRTRFEQDLQSGKDTPAESIHSDAEPSSDETSRRHSGGVSSPPTSQDGISLEALAKDQKRAVEDEKKRQKSEHATLQKLERAIRRDLGARTSYSKFLMSAGLQEGLFGICKAYALFDEDVGYAQGMNFIAMPLLFNMAEEEAFCLFVRLMNNYQLRDLFIQDMPGLHLHLYQFERVLEDLEPAVYCHLRRRGVTPQLYATQWFLTLFAYRFPLQLVLRIYDLILSDGLESAIIKFGIVLMQKNAAQLLEMKDMSVLTTFLKERLFDCYIDKSPSASSVLESGFFGSTGGIDREIYRADELVRDACAVQVTPEILKAYAAEWREQDRDAKERSAAEDAIRASNTSLTLKVRQLEERCEKSDTEHVQLASDLVRTKVDNQRLADDNESLQGRVRNLQEIIQAQPGEVEERLRQEMDRIMKRNIEVQNENRALEESTAEMEGELVQAKLKHAEISSELDAMRQKWSSVTQMMSGLSSPPAT